MKRKLSSMVVGAVVAAGIVAVGSAAHAGTPSTADLIITYTADGPAAAEIEAAITPELYDEAGDLVPDTDCDTSTSSGDVVYTCTVAGGETYTVGIADVPLSGTVFNVSCENSPQLNDDLLIGSDTIRLDGEFGANAQSQIFSLTQSCDVFLTTNPGIHVDTVIVGGPATVADFTYDLQDDGGTTVATDIVDPAAAECTLLGLPFDGDPTDCSTTRAPEGDYTLVEKTTANSYVPTDFRCESDNDDGPISPPGATEPGTFTHRPIEAPGTLCTVTYTYLTQEIAVDVVVVNDDGGTATADDVTVELRDTATNTILQTGKDPEPGTGNASLIFTVPLGDYTITATGPQGYSIEIATTVIDRQPDTVAVAGLAVNETQSFNAVITADDPAPTPTTTTTTTTTTLPPTTVAPTTTILTGELPATGSSSSTWPLTVLAAFLLFTGMGVVLAARRR